MFWLQFFIIFMMTASFLGCAGPTDPFGAGAWKKKESLPPVTFATNFIGDNNKKTATGESKDINISFFPPFQNWHGNQHVTVIIEGEEDISPLYKLRIYFNGKDLTEEMEDDIYKRWEKWGKRLVISFPKLRLLPGRRNEMSLYFQPHPLRDYVVARYPTPECPLESDWHLNADFLPDSGKRLIAKMDRYSRQNNFNPALTAGLIQQESNFNIQAVSSAKALGLTQVTPLASEEILKRFPDWLQDERASDLPAAVLRILVQSGTLTRHHDWRLNEDKSIRGGLAYMEMLKNLWQTSEYRLYLSTLERVAIEDILLASYHSGPSRVRDAIKTHSDNWSLSSDLGQARYYVGKVKSYCAVHAAKSNNNLSLIR